MQPLVLKALRRQGAKSVRVLGTPDSIQAYQSALTADDPDLTLEETPEDQVAAYEACIVAAIQGQEVPAAQLASLRKVTEQAKARSVSTLEACTDLVLGLGHDALALYAEALVEQVYP
jgi:aspartate/glutamate racemase